MERNTTVTVYVQFGTFQFPRGPHVEQPILFVA